MKQPISWYSQSPEQKKSWYAPVADAYDKARPRYPKQLVQRVVEVAQLSSESAILELGCGPGTATAEFAQRGFSLVCLEPNQAFCDLARRNCAQSPGVEIRNSSFEEWKLEAQRFDAVLAATSFHWMTPEVRYAKSHAALRDPGALILLWNKEPAPSHAAYQELHEIYEVHAPALIQYKDRASQEKILRDFGQGVLDSGLFKDLVSEQILCDVVYSTDDYLTLLSTLSPYIGLDSQSRHALFEGLRGKIEKCFGGSIELSYLSAFHIAWKC